MTTDTMLIFTRKSKETILQTGGSESWVLDRARARQCRYAVLCRNRHDTLSEGEEPHGHGFMIGRVKDIVEANPAPNRKPGRWLITFDAYAEISIPQLWSGLRNPVNYTTLDSLGIDESKLEFQPMPERVRPTSEPIIQDAEAEPTMTIAEAKIRLARTFHVSPDAIEITVRG